MKRVIVLGGSGFFGRLIVEKLTEAGLQPIPASRSSAGMRIDANNPEDLRVNLKQRDLVIDAAGPFQTRNPALIEAARTIGFDVIDLSDSPDYTSMIYEHEVPIRAAGIRVLTACSALSTLSALILKASGFENPRSLNVYLRPASRYTANPAALQSFLAGVQGKTRVIQFREPLGRRSGLTVRTVDAVTLKRAFPSLQTVELIVDCGIPAANALLRSRTFRRLLGRFQDKAIRIAHRIGPANGLLAFEIASTMHRKQEAFWGPRSYMVAVIPAIEAAIAIAAGRYPHRGLVSPADHVTYAAFHEALRRENITTAAA